MHSDVPYSVRELIYNRAMKKENKGTEPKKVGYLKYLRLHREEVKPTDDMLYRIDDEFAFMKKYQPGGLLYFLIRLPHRISNKIDRYKIEHLKLGKQKWRDGNYKFSLTASHSAMRFWLLQYGKYVKLLLPQSLVKQIKSDIKEMSKLYSEEK